MNKKSSAVAFASTLLLVGMLGACTKPMQNRSPVSSTSNDVSKPAAGAGANTATSAGSSASGTSATGTDVGQGAPSTANLTDGAAAGGTASGGTSGSVASATGAGADALKSAETSKKNGAAPSAGDGGFTSDLPPRLSINLNDLPDDMVICHVSGTAITIADYRRRLKLQQAQTQSQVTTNPALQARLFQLAKQNKLQLTAEEKTKLIAAAKAQHAGDLAQFLKQHNVSEAEFEKQVEEAGLLFKVANMQLQEQLLPELIKQQIMVKAATDAGGKKTAEANFEKFKHTDAYKQVKSLTQLSDDSLRSELVKGELAKMEVDKLGNSVKVSDSEVRNWYNHNKSQLQHNERIRLSAILIVAPGKDVGSIKSVRTQLKAANPKWTDAELDSKTAAYNTQAQNQALILLGLLKAPGSDFAKLANEHNPGPKTGGDMGWQEKAQLAPDFVNAVWNLKAGTVLPQVVKTEEGFRIIKVTAREPKGPFSLSDVRGAVAQKLKAAKVEQTVNNWVTAQQSGAKIEFSKRFLAAAGDKSKTN